MQNASSLYGPQTPLCMRAPCGGGHVEGKLSSVCWVSNALDGWCTTTFFCRAASQGEAHVNGLCSPRRHKRRARRSRVQRLSVRGEHGDAKRVVPIRSTDTIGCESTCVLRTRTILTSGDSDALVGPHGRGKSFGRVVTGSNRVIMGIQAA